MVETASPKRGEPRPQLPFTERSLCAKHLHSVTRLTPSPNVVGSRMIMYGPEGGDSPRVTELGCGKGWS